MKTALFVLIAIFGVAILIVVGRPPGPQSPVTRMTRDQVISLANAEATKDKYDLTLYNQPDVQYEPYQHDGKWHLYYHQKRGLGHFFVLIEDKPAAVQLLHGE